MGYSNEIVSKVIAGYLGCEVKNTIQDVDNELLCLNECDEGITMSIFIHFYKEGYYKLLLRPLSSISDEDAIKVVEISGHPSELDPSGNALLGRIIIGWIFDPYNANVISNQLQICQYLKDKGYSMPEYLLDGLDPITAKIAIEKI